MRKHFLLFFLMLLLPLGAWAADPVEVTVTLYDFTIPYNGTADPTVATLPAGAMKIEPAGLTEDQINAVKGYLTFARVDDGTANWDSKNVGVYSWTLTKPASTPGYTIYLSSNNAKLTIEKADNEVTNTPTVNGGGAYNAAGYDLVATVPTVKFGTVKYNVTNSAVVPAANAAGWTTTEPHVAKPGTYYVYIMVDEDDVNGNYNALAPQKIAATNEVVITGTEIPAAEYTLPAALGAAIPFDNTAHPLATAGSLSDEHPHCTGIEYSLDGVDWSTSVPTATAATGYTVYYRILGIEGWYDKTGNVAATISPAAPTVTSATAASDLVYTGEAQELLSKAGSASIGATPTYSVKYATTNLDDWSGETATAIENSADVKGTDAGFYQVTTLVATGGNYVAAAATPIVVQIGTKAAFTAAPTAKTGLVWNKNPQQLIVEGTSTVAGKVKYSTDNATWTTDITTITGTAAGNYTVYYKVDDPNYTAVASTLIENVKIAKKVLSVKVNNATKTYDSGTSLAGVAVDGGGDAFTYIGRIASDGVDFTGVKYAAVTKKNEGTYVDALTADNLPASNYDYTIIPGTLTIEKKDLTVTANTGATVTAVYHTAYDIRNAYTITGYAGTENKADVFTTDPILTTTAAAENPEPGEYPLAFTEGVLVANPNYTVTYVIPDGDKFTVTPDPSSKIVITVLPKTITYGDAEDYTNFVAGTDYYVTGLIGDDVLTTAPTFSRSDASNKNAGTYDLIAENAAVADPSKYPGGFVYNNSTIEITPAELTATVDQQTVAKDADVTALDQTAWTVTGLKGSDAEAADVKTLLGASLSFNKTEGDVADRADVANPGLYNKGIKLAITNGNYTLKAGSEFGKLLVISDTQFALDPTDADLVSKLATADGDSYSVVFANKTTNIGEWYAMVLPFEVDPLKMVQAFNRYVIFNELNIAGTTAETFKFTLTMNPIPAGTPFLIKFAPKDGDAADAVVDWAHDFNSGTYGKVTIEEDITDVVAPGLVTFTGIYEQKVMQNTKNGANTADIQANVWWLADKSYKGDNAWKKPTNTPHTTKAMEAYLKAGDDFAVYAPKITVEDFDGQTTAIKSISVEQIHNMTVDGLYNMNGMKMQGVPTQKGVYIQNGKKVVIK